MKAFNVRTVLGAISAASTRFAAKLVSVLVVAFFVCAHAYAQDARSLRVYYPFDNAVVSDSYLGNHPTLIKVDSVAAAAIGIRLSPQGVLPHFAITSSRNTPNLKAALK